MAAAGTAHLDVSDATGSVAWERGSNSGGSGCSGSPVRDDAQTTMDALSSEVLDLKTCVRAHEDRLAALYGTKDRSMWTGTPSLLTDLEVAERQVESLEDEVTELRGQLDSMCDGADVSFASDGSSDGGGSGSTGGGRSAERSKEVSRGKQELRHRRKIRISELRAKVAGLEEDNKILAHAAGWEMGDTLEKEEEKKMPTSREQMRRLTAVQVLRTRLLELAARLSQAEEKEVAARQTAEEATAGREKADARAVELYSAAQHYKRGKIAAEQGMEALRVELVQVCVSAETDRAAQAEQAADEEANDTRRGVAGDGEKRETGGRRERLVSQGSQTHTQALLTQGSQTSPAEEVGNVPAVNERIAKLERELNIWREACTRANEQLRQEASIANATNRLLAEHDKTIQSLVGRLEAGTSAQPRTSTQTNAPCHGQELHRHQGCPESEGENGHTSPEESGVSTQDDSTWSGVRVGSSSIEWRSTRKDAHAAAAAAAAAAEPAPVQKTSLGFSRGHHNAGELDGEGTVDRLVNVNHNSDNGNDTDGSKFWTSSSTFFGARGRGPSSANFDDENNGNGTDGSKVWTSSSTVFGARPGRTSSANLDHDDDSNSNETDGSKVWTSSSTVFGARTGGRLSANLDHDDHNENETDDSKVWTSSSTVLGTRARQLRSSSDNSEAVDAAIAAVRAAEAAQARVTEAAAPRVEIDEVGYFRDGGEMCPTVADGEAGQILELVDGQGSGSGKHTASLSVTEVFLGASSSVEGGSKSAGGADGHRRPTHPFATGDSDDNGRLERRSRRAEGDRQASAQAVTANSSAETVADNTKVSFDLTEDGECERAHDEGRVMAAMAVTNGVDTGGGVIGSSDSSQHDGQDTGASTSSTAMDRLAEPADREDLSTSGDAPTSSSSPGTAQDHHQQQHQQRRRRRQLPSSGITEVEAFSAESGQECVLCRCQGDSAAFEAQRAAERSEHAAGRAELAAHHAHCSAQVSQRAAIQMEVAAANNAPVVAFATLPTPRPSENAAGDRQKGDGGLSRRQEPVDADAAAARRAKRAKRAARLAERAAVAARLRRLAEATAAEESISSRSSLSSSCASSLAGSITEERGGGEESPIVRNPASWDTSGGQLSCPGKPVEGTGTATSGNAGGAPRQGFRIHSERRGERRGKAEEEEGEEEKENEDSGAVDSPESEQFRFSYGGGERAGSRTRPEEEERVMRRVQWVVEQQHASASQRDGGRPPRAEEAWTQERHDPRTSVKHDYLTAAVNEMAAAAAAESTSGEAAFATTTEPPLATRGVKALPILSQMPRLDEEDSQGMPPSQLSDEGRSSMDDDEDKTEEREERWMETALGQDKISRPRASEEGLWREESHPLPKGEKNQERQRWTAVGRESDTFSSSFADQNTAGSLRPIDLAVPPAAAIEDDGVDQNHEQWQYWERPVMDAANEESPSSVTADDSFQHNHLTTGIAAVEELGGGGAGAGGAGIGNPKTKQTEPQFYEEDAAADDIAAYGARLRSSRRDPVSSWDVQAAPGSNVVGGRGGRASTREARRGPSEVKKGCGDPLAFSRGRAFTSLERRPLSSLRGRARSGGSMVNSSTSTGKVKKKTKVAKRAGSKASMTVTVDGCRSSESGRCGLPHPHSAVCARSCACPTCPCGEARALSSPAMWHARQRRSVSHRTR